VQIIKDEYASESSAQLTKQEAELLFQLDHPNVIKVKHLVQFEGKLYLAMELVTGGSLQKLIKTRGKMSDS
jgi:serine/threonine protein kinase